MHSTTSMTRQSSVRGLRPLQKPKPEIADRGNIRLGSGSITATFPPLQKPKPEIADRGHIRLGSGSITATFPPLR